MTQEILQASLSSLKRLRGELTGRVQGAVDKVVAQASTSPGDALGLTRKLGETLVHHLDPKKLHEPTGKERHNFNLWVDNLIKAAVVPVTIGDHLKNLRKRANPGAHDNDDPGAQAAELSMALHTLAELLTWFVGWEEDQAGASPDVADGQPDFSQQSRLHLAEVAEEGWRIRGLLTTIALLTAAAIVLGGLLIQETAHALGGRTQLRLAAGSPLASFHETGLGLASILAPQFQVDVLNTRGAAENLERLCRGTAELALTHANISPPCTGIVAIARLQPSVLHIVVRVESGIQRLQDITSTHRVAVGPPGSGTAAVAQMVLRQYGLEPREVPVSNFDDARSKLESGDVQVAFIAGSIPLPFPDGLAHSAEYTLLPVDEIDAIRRRYAYLTREEIPTGVYGGHPAFPAANIVSLGVPSVLVASPSLTSSVGAARTMFGIARAITERGPAGARSHAALVGIDLNSRPDLVGYPQADGVRAYVEHETTLGLAPEDAHLASAAATFLLCCAALWLTIRGLRRERWRQNFQAKIRDALKCVSKPDGRAIPSATKGDLADARNTLAALDKEFFRDAPRYGLQVQGPMFQLMLSCVKEVRFREHQFHAPATDPTGAVPASAHARTQPDTAKVSNERHGAPPSDSTRATQVD